MKPLDFVVSGLAPILKGTGFKRFGPTFNREREPGLIQVVNFQGSKWGDEFTVNIGVHLAELWALEVENQLQVAARLRAGRPKLFEGLPPASSPKPKRYVAGYECQLRLRVGNLVAPHEDRWWKYQQLETAGSDVAEILKAEAFRYLDLYASRADIANRWMSGVGRQFPGDWTERGPAPISLMLKAALLKELGKLPEAMELVRHDLDLSVGQLWHESSVWFAERLGFQLTQWPR